MKISLLFPHQPQHDIFLQFMTKVLHVSQWFGVAGPRGLVSRVWGLFIMTLLIVIECGSLWKVTKALAGWAVDTAKQRSVTARFAGAMFYAAAITSQILIWRLSSSWSRLSKYWYSIEWTLSIKYVQEDKLLKRRLTMVMIFICTGGAVEHLMNIISTTKLNGPLSEALRAYILNSHGFLILETDYYEAIAIPVAFASNIATLLWNFLDLVIILFSMGLTSRYLRLNDSIATICFSDNKDNKVIKANDKNMELIVFRVYLWRKIREAYVNQAKLVRKLDDALGVLVMFSCFFNFYFICLHLFLGITRGVTGHPLQQVYYLLSLSWISIRASCVVLAAADVNQHSNKALPYLCDIQPYYYNIEIQRLQEQLTNDRVALSGMGFFNLTRAVLLQVASSVITYVLVLVQYDNSDRNDQQDTRNDTKLPSTPLI